MKRYVVTVCCLALLIVTVSAFQRYDRKCLFEKKTGLSLAMFNHVKIFGKENLDGSGLRWRGFYRLRMSPNSSKIRDSCNLTGAIRDLICPVGVMTKLSCVRCNIRFLGLRHCVIGVFLRTHVKETVLQMKTYIFYCTKAVEDE